MSIATICVAGAESTGKSWLAAKIAVHFSVTPVTEYARAYCAAHGNDLSMAQLVHVGEVQDSNIRNMVRETRHHGGEWVVADTDAIVTSVWAQMGDAAVDPWFGGGLFECDLYLITDNDLPWVDDGVRIQTAQSERDRFRATLIAEIERRGLRWAAVGGHGEARLTNALAEIEAALRG